MKKNILTIATALAMGLCAAIGGVALGIGGWISRAGGQVSHSEFRTGPEPTNAPAHQHTHTDK